MAMATLARSVLVTGSNRGIGLELVRQLAASPRPPQHIFATCRDASGLRGKALQELAARHPSIKLIQLDTVDLPSIRGAMQTVETHLEGQGLNLLINNAGVGSQATLQSVDAQEMLATFAVNVVGPLQVAKEFLPLLEKAAKDAGTEGLSCSRAAIINVSSKVGSIGLCLGVLEAPMYPYRASKAAQNMVTRCLAEELRDKGILCAAIHPGWVKTDMGTEQAPMTVERSMQGILEVLGILSQETCGAFLDWEGNRLPW
uniref:C-factor n=1 Tax=Phasianus colchicus TaxID=9054 RepID=A0A669QT92_PHACC